MTCEVLSGTVHDRLICHYWYNNGPVPYSGRIESLKAGTKDVYVVAYWQIDEDCSVVIDYDMSKFEIACVTYYTKT